MTTRRFSHSFHAKVKPPADEPCALKWHYSGVMREIVGYFDYWANRDPERFVYANYETVCKNCKRFNGLGYSKSAFWQAMRELRERRIISDQVVRERCVPSGKKGHMVLRKLKGCIVAPHDCVTRMEADVCSFLGPMRGCGRWQRTGDGGPGSVLYWNSCGLHAPATGGLPNGKQLLSAPNAGESAVPCAVPSTVVSTAANAAASTVPSTVSTSAQISDLSEVSPKNGDQSVVTVIPGVSRENREEPEQPVKPAPLVQAAAQVQTGASLSSSLSGACSPYGHDVTKPLGSETTIGQHFAIADDIELLQGISDGEFNVYPYKETGDIDLLAEYTRMVVEKNAAQPWDNQRATCARLMDSVAKQIKRDGQEYPAGWLAVIYELRNGGKCVVTIRRKFQQPGGWGDLAVIRATLKKYNNTYKNNGSGWEMCGDGICRQQADRETQGFTLKAADGIWDKA